MRMNEARPFRGSRRQRVSSGLTLIALSIGSLARMTGNLDPDARQFRFPHLRNKGYKGASSQIATAEQRQGRYAPDSKRKSSFFLLQERGQQGQSRIVQCESVLLLLKPLVLIRLPCLTLRPEVSFARKVFDLCLHGWSAPSCCPVRWDEGLEPRGKH